MPAYATAEKDGTEVDKPEHEPTDDRYRHLKGEIRMRDVNMAAMKAKMKVVIAQIWSTSLVEPANRGISASANLGATTSVNPHHGSTFNPMAFSPLL